MALVRGDECDSRWSYIFRNQDDMIEIAGLGCFTTKQFLALVKAYPQDFPEDILDRLVAEQQAVIKALLKSNRSSRKFSYAIELHDKIIAELESKL
jgi:hypothetical protein